MLLMLVSHTTWRIPNFDYRVAFGWDNMIVPDLSQSHALLGFLLQAASPIFFLLAGMSLAMFITSRQQRNWTSHEITRFLVIRGAILIGLDLTLVNLDLLPQSYGYRISVLTAIGLSLIWMAFLRHLPLAVLGLIALGLTLTTQALYATYGQPFSESLLVAVLLAPQHTAPWSVEFSLLPWLPVALLGYLTMRVIQIWRWSFVSVMLGLSAISGFAWIVVIWANGFGSLYRDSRLIFTKHPPDLTYLLVYLALACLLLAAYRAGGAHVPALLHRGLSLLGRNALIFYVLHPKVLDSLYLLAESITHKPFTLSMLLTLLSIPPLLLICLLYSRLRQRYPTSVIRYF